MTAVGNQENPSARPVFITYLERGGLSNENGAQADSR
jgi:hypothetical protein